MLDSGIEVKPVYGSADLPAGEPEPPGRFPFTRGPVSRTCTAGSRGRSGSTRASPRPRSRTTASATCSDRARPVFRSRSTCRPSSATTPTTLSRRARSAAPASRSTRSPTWRSLLDSIPLDEVSTSMTINAPASLLLLLYELVAEGQGVPGIGAARHGAERHPEGVHRARELHLPATAVDATDDGPVRLLRGADPAAGTRSRSRGYHIREAGSTAAQELAFTLANGIAYCEAAVAAGLSPDAFGARLSFFFNAHNDFFQEVAKFRAARTLWAQIMRDRFGATNPKAQALRFHAQTGGSTLTAQQPENNVVRVAVQALSAVLRRSPVAAHEQLRRGARPADRACRHDRAPHAADPDARGGHDRHGRPARRLVLHRGAHGRARGACARADRARRRARRRGRRDRGRLRAGRDRGGGVPLPDADRERRAGRSSGSTVFTRGGRERVELHRVDPEAERRQRERTALRPRGAQCRTRRAAALAAVRETAAGTATCCPRCARRCVRAARWERSAAPCGSSGAPTTSAE